MWPPAAPLCYRLNIVSAMAQPVEIQNVRFEHHRHQQALGLGTSTPRVSWNYRATNSGYCHNWVQTAYDIEISRGPPVVGECIYHVKSSDYSLLVPWPAEALASRGPCQGIRQQLCSNRMVHGH
ncbi:hypothetical protein BJX68DRAFT_235109 [Aspergillus pseudodeflectus]|uniref:Uncharacterized protein n=1 Tax=Aspergillus pseudodeflectus TaxID=176178 RepID=A0ABR4KLV6_9EURO